MRQRQHGAPRRRLIYILPAVGVCLAAIVLLAVFHPRQSAGRGAGPTTPAASQTKKVVQSVTTIPAATLAAAGVGGARAPELVAGGTPSAHVLYVGAEFCPYCAAERWPLVVALSRFGTFSGLGLTTSSATDVDPSTHTLTFLHASYTSPNLTFTGIELYGNKKGQNGQYPVLERLTKSQQSIVAHYDAPPYVPSQQYAGSIPFLLVGGRYVWVGTSYDASLLKGKSWTEIASAVRSGKGPIAAAVLTNANEISAAICASDGGKPASVCGAPAVKSAMKTLPTKSPS